MNSTNTSWSKIVGLHEIFFLLGGNRSGKVRHPMEKVAGPANDDITRTVEKSGVKFKNIHVASGIQAHRAGDGRASVMFIDMRAALKFPNNDPALVGTRVCCPPLEASVSSHKVLKEFWVLLLENCIELQVNLFTGSEVLAYGFGGTGISVIRSRRREFLKVYHQLGKVNMERPYMSVMATLRPCLHDMARPNTLSLGLLFPI